MRLTTIPLAALTFLAISALPASAANNVDGIWVGKLNFGANGTLRVVVTVNTDAAGKLKASLKSPDQSPAAIALDGITLSNKTVEFRSKALDATYTGTLNDTATEVKGTFTQHGADQPLVLDKTDKEPGPEGTKLTADQVTEFAGKWKGSIDAGGTTLHLIADISKGAGGDYFSLITSVDQGNARIASTFSVSGDVLEIKATGIGGNFRGTASADHQKIVGTWNQNGAAFPLTFTKSP